MHAFSILKDCFRLCPKLCLCLLGISISITLEHNLNPGQIMCVCAGELAVRANAVACDCLSTSPNTNNLFCLNTCSNLWQRIAAQYGSNEMEHPEPNQKIRNRFSSCQGAELRSCVQYMSEGRCRRNSKASKCDPLNQ